MEIKKNKYKRYIFILIISILLEIFLFNFRYFESIGYKSFTPESFEYGAGLEYKGDNIVFVGDDKDAYIEFKNFYVPVKNIYLDIMNRGYYMDDVYYSDPYGVVVELNLADGANRNYMYITEPVNMPERVIVQGVERTKYLKIYSAGESDKLKIDLSANLGKEIVINEVSFNKQVPFTFNLIRLFLIFAAAAVVTALRRGSEIYNEKCVFNTNQRLIKLAVVFLNLLFVMYILSVNPYMGNTGYRDQYNNLAYSFTKGNLYLDIEPPEDLKNMDNPYDPGLREKMLKVINFQWDTAYYNGKYYVYFGALPVLVYHLPFRLIFGRSFMDKWGVIINCWAYVVFAYALLESIIKRWFKNIPFVNYIFMAQVMIYASYIGFILRRADLYTLPVSMAMALTVAGLYFWVSTGLCSSRLKQGIQLFAGSLCMALVSACRPQFLIASFLAIPLFWSEVFKKRELFSKRSVGRSIAFVLPYVVVAAGVMWYNYARFGSVLDFGANYNLTTNDMTQRGFVPGRLPLGIFTYLFQPMSLCPIFPFVTETNSFTNYMGITIREAMYGGIIVSQPFIWLIYYTKACAKELKKKGLLTFSVLSMILSVMVACVDTEMSGVIYRYCMDFSYLMLLGVIPVALTLIENGGTKMQHRVSMLCLGSIVYSTLLIFVRYNVGVHYNPVFYYGVASAVCFWL